MRYRLLLILSFFYFSALYSQTQVISSWYRNTTGATNPTPGYTTLQCDVQSV